MVGVIIITHNAIGDEMLKTAEQIVGRQLPSVSSIGIPGDIQPERLAEYADLTRATIDRMDQGDGILIVTDMFGATPNNLAQYFAEDHRVKIISGLNVSMLIRIINYSDQPLELLAKIGIVGGNKGITRETDV